MSRLRAHLGWLLRGHDHVGNALEVLSHDLRELQLKVGQLDHAIAAMPSYLDTQITEVSTQLATTNAEQLKHLQAARNACDRATDDLAERIAAIHERLP
jgi:chromosome segregation ATPase